MGEIVWTPSHSSTGFHWYIPAKILPLPPHSVKISVPSPPKYLHLTSLTINNSDLLAGIRKFMSYVGYVSYVDVCLAQMR